MAMIGIYAAPDRDIEISGSTSPSDLAELRTYALQHIKSGSHEGWRVGNEMLSAIAELQASKPLMFKSVRAA